MIDPKQIPDEAVEAARDAFFSNKGMRGAIAAAINAWPQAEVQVGEYAGEPYEDLVLPLPQEGDT